MVSRRQEILTFQLGNYSNFIGSHFWNLQDEYYLRLSSETESVCQDEFDFLVNFRMGVNDNDEVRLYPRCLFVDEIANFGNLLCDDEIRVEDIETWGGTISTPFSPPVPLDDDLDEEEKVVDGEEEGKLDFQQFLKMEEENKDPSLDVVKNFYSFNFEQTIKSWVDYSKFDPHPNSLLPLQLESEVSEMVEDGVRWMLEEADWVDSFQMIFDIQSDSPLTSKSYLSLLSELHDQSPKVSILAFQEMASYSRGQLSSKGNVYQALALLKLVDSIPLSNSIIIPSFTNSTNNPYQQFLNAPLPSVALELFNGCSKSVSQKVPQNEISQHLHETFHSKFPIIDFQLSPFLYKSSNQKLNLSDNPFYSLLYPKQAIRQVDIESFECFLARGASDFHSSFHSTSSPIPLPLCFPSPLLSGEVDLFDPSIGVISTVSHSDSDHLLSTFQSVLSPFIKEDEANMHINYGRQLKHQQFRWDSTDKELWDVEEEDFDELEETCYQLLDEFSSGSNVQEVHLDD